MTATLAIITKISRTLKILYIRKSILIEDYEDWLDDICTQHSLNHLEIQRNSRTIECTIQEISTSDKMLSYFLDDNLFEHIDLNSM